MSSEAAVVTDGGLVNRASESSALHDFLDEMPGGVSGLQLVGEAGIGKSILWQAGCRIAEGRGWRLLLTRPAEADARYAFAGLRDLLEPVYDRIVSVLPPLQRDALEVALLRASGRHVDHRTVSAAVLGGIRSLTRMEPVCIAVDDAQWLDRSTARVLAFSLRRLQGARVRLLVTRRSQVRSASADALIDCFEDGHLTTLALGPLEPAILREVLHQRLRHALPPAVLARVVAASRGNPLCALEIGRAVLEHDFEPSPADLLPSPYRIRALVSRRVANLPVTTMDALCMVAALSKPSLPVLRRALPRADAVLVPAAKLGMIAIDVDGVRFTHPLFGSVVYEQTPATRRRWIHRRLAQATTEAEERARHLALGATGPDAETAAVLDRAAAAATDRGAPDAGAHLTELAIDATPADEPHERWRRTLVAADRHFEVGNLLRARALLEALLAESSPATVQSDVLCRLGAMAGYSGKLELAVSLLEKAGVLAGDDPGRRCVSEQLLTFAEICAGEYRSAHRRAARTLAEAESLGDERLLIFSLGNLSCTTFVLGGGVPRDLLDRALSLEAWADPSLAERHPRFMRGAVLRFADELDEARAALESCLALFRETGAYAKLPTIAWHLSELECWSGDWPRAAELAREAVDNARASGSDLPLAYALYSLATIDAHAGRTDSARAAAEEGLRLANRAGDRTVAILLHSALGFLELSLGDAAAAHSRLGPLVPLLHDAGIEEPGQFRFPPDEVEALVALGQLEEAERLLAWFEERARRLARPWALATGARCRGLLHAARGELVAAENALREAVAHHAAVRQPFELGRTMLVQGVIQRRLRQKSAPRATFKRALEIFETLGAALWSDRAIEQLARTGPAAPPPTELSPTERRIASLAVSGRTNRQIAAQLSVRPKTVEANLSRIYRKTGARSRTELARIWPVSSGADTASAASRSAGFLQGGFPLSSSPAATDSGRTGPGAETGGS